MGRSFEARQLGKYLDTFGEPSPTAENEWTEHVYEPVQAKLFPTLDSWFFEIDDNLPEKKRTFRLYSGATPTYRQKCDEVGANAYAGFRLR